MLALLLPPWVTNAWSDSHGWAICSGYWIGRTDRVCRSSRLARRRAATLRMLSHHGRQEGSTSYILGFQRFLMISCCKMVEDSVVAFRGLSWDVPEDSLGTEARSDSFS